MRLSTEENINKFNDTAVDNIQTEPHRGKKMKKKNQISSVCFGKKEPEEGQNNDWKISKDENGTHRVTRNSMNHKQDKHIYTWNISIIITLLETSDLKCNQRGEKDTVCKQQQT